MMSSSSPAGGPQLHEALSYLEGIVRDGVRHGFFSYTVTCEVGRNQRREIIIKNGKSRKFTIPEAEIAE